MLVALLDQFFENYTTFSLSVLYQKKKKRNERSPNYVFVVN